MAKYKSLDDAISHSVLTEEQVAQANRSRIETRRSQPKMLAPHLPPAMPPLALLPKEEKGQGMKPHPTISGLYEDEARPGMVFTSHGVQAAQDFERRTNIPACLKCLDNVFVLMKPPSGRSAGPWDGQLVACTHS